ncbi:glycoside hydrolase family 2 [Vibrio sp. 10N.286.49.C2]|uniref:glycoside hydrolase family 2 protein n=1 Tax=unclassified Vibrio TaxID=2614977 RepID=UPI000C85DB8E|nr:MULTISPECIES: sugar-binding domain-containing protein [unclassified Vibrio]PMH26388.1 glycoside hydrolase family 2 [Vibrio sp. 10N.286.49.C2]PMH54888.1 glycoside hydrolase family 2 [Vibrio sp. 10N.286.49.B1]PMH79584.1 glycoside hydrolase family 2 [Vibrio sp. 10N.286.48.B7]
MTRQIQDLSGCRWQMERMRPGQGKIEGLHLLPAEYQGTTFSWNFAAVPGDVYTDLYRVGELDDPNFGRNMHRAKWVQEYEWWYQRRFAIDPAMKGQQIRLIFEGVDYSCEVWLNGQFLGSHEGMFSSFYFDITDIVSYEDWKDGSNNLMVKLNPPPKNYRNCGGKKVNFSGDYFSGLVPFGIWQPVKIEASDPTRIKEICTDVTLQDDNTAILHLEVVVNNSNQESKSICLAAILNGKNCETTTTSHQLSVLAPPGETTIQTKIVVKDAQLWWPWDMGKPNLYKLDVSLLSEKTSTLDTYTETIGLREVSMEMNPGFTEEEAEFPWTFKINGKRHFLRSACWGGQPSFFYGRNNDEKYQHRLNLVKEANINNLRIFGWHPPEVPEFYKLCDELGITVWTNFTLATQAYPKDEDFVQGVLHECLETVKQRRNHPSQIFWMGGEEVFFSGAHEKSGNKMLMERIGKIVNSATAVPYGLASPLSSESAINMGFKPKESIHANEHYYQGGAEFMEEYYPSLDCAIIPELTAASAPNVESLKRFIPEDELWPMGPSWAYHWADIDILKNLNFEVFNDYRIDSLEQFVEATQIAQGTVIQYALETYRRRKPKMSGVAICHFITHVPDIKWGVVDYYGEKKRSFGYLKRAYQPLLPSLAFHKRRWKSGEEFNAELWIVNDYQHEHRDLILEWQVMYQGQPTGRKDQVQISVKPDSSESISKVSWLIPGDADGTFDIECIIREQNGNVVATNLYTLLIGDQEKAKAQSLAYLAQAKKRLEKHGHGVYRYWPEMWKID